MLCALTKFWAALLCNPHVFACAGIKGPQNGPPILLIHGFGASVGHFRKNIPVLAGEGYRVYAIDLLGFGASDKPKDVEVGGKGGAGAGVRRLMW